MQLYFKILYIYLYQGNYNTSHKKSCSNFPPSDSNHFLNFILTWTWDFSFRNIKLNF